MLKKIAGLLILLSFLLVKTAPLFAAVQHAEKTVTCCTEEGTDDTGDAEKENKQLETADEDLRGQPVPGPATFIVPENTGYAIVPDVTAPYLSLPYPPPNCCS